MWVQKSTSSTRNMYTNKVNDRMAAIINLCQKYRNENGLTYVPREAKSSPNAIAIFSLLVKLLTRYYDHTPTGIPTSAN